MSNPPKNTPPECFGDLEIVFPLKDDGLRHTPASCFQCCFKTECLRTGLSGKGGLKVREEKIDRSYRSGMMGFMERWSKKKTLNRQKKLKEKMRSKWPLTRRKIKPSN